MITLNAQGKPVEVTEKLIDAAALEAEKIRFEMAITDLPKLKKTPDQETLDFWNNQVRQFGLNKASIESKIADLDKTLTYIKNL